MAGQHYCLRWNNYQSNMTSVFHHLLRTQAFVDVTLACNGHSLKAHKVVLSACSSYFQKLLLENPCKHPTIIMPQDVCFTDLKFIIEFVYRGEIDVSQAELQSLLKTADQLKIKGLCEVEDGGGKECAVGAEVTPLPSPPGSVHGGGGGGSASGGSSSGRRGVGGPVVRNRRLIHRRRFVRNQYRERMQAAGQAGIANASPAPPPPPPPPTTPLAPPPSAAPSPALHHPHHHHHQDVGLVTQHSPQMGNCLEMSDGSRTGVEDRKDIGQQVMVVDQGLGGNNGGGAGGGGGGGNEHHTTAIMMTTATPPTMLTTAPMSTTPTTHQVMVDPTGAGVRDPEDAATPQGPTATLVTTMDMQTDTHRDIAVDATGLDVDDDSVKVKFETLRAIDQSDHIDMDHHHLTDRSVDDEHAMHTMMITPELLGLIPSSSSSQADSGGEMCVGGGGGSNGKGSNGIGGGSGGGKSWSQDDMEAALEALRSQTMSLTKASLHYGIPSTTLWQRAHRLGIDTPKKDGPAKSWTEDSLNIALEALRSGSISANKASKTYGIPSSTLYKIARREGIRLATPFNAAPTTWNNDDLERALEAIRSGQCTVQRAATEYGIPSGTLYGRCKREGIGLSRSNPTPWSEDAMTEALEAVRVGQMSINQAAIHYNLPYSSLYGRFKRVKYEGMEGGGGANGGGSDQQQQQQQQQQELLHSPPPQHQPAPAPPPPPPPQIMLVQYQQTPAIHMYQA